MDTKRCYRGTIAIDPTFTGLVISFHQEGFSGEIVEKFKKLLSMIL